MPPQSLPANRECFRSSFLFSSVGRKFIVAITGLALIGFVVMHLLGNLQMFLGPDPINSYAKTLQDLGPIIWVARISLLVFLVTHVYVSIALSRENQAARPEAYKYDATVGATWASLHMRMTGLVILAFLIIHLMHFTFRWLHPEFTTFFDEQGRNDVYRMVVIGFQNRFYAFGYIIAVAFLGVHLSHAISSVFQTLGVSSPSTRKRLEKFAFAISLFISIGYMSIPVSVLIGIVTL